MAAWRFLSPNVQCTGWGYEADFAKVNREMFIYSLDPRLFMRSGIRTYVLPLQFPYWSTLRLGIIKKRKIKIKKRGKGKWPHIATWGLCLTRNKEVKEQQGCSIDKMLIDPPPVTTQRDLVSNWNGKQLNTIRKTRNWNKIKRYQSQLQLQKWQKKH